MKKDKLGVLFHAMLLCFATDKDVCKRATSKYEHKGAIDWPATAVGSRVIVRCPYSYDEPLYAHRDCVLSLSDQSPKWSNANLTTCPYSPFHQGVQRLASLMVTIILPFICCLTMSYPGVFIIIARKNCPRSRRDRPYQPDPQR